MTNNAKFYIDNERGYAVLLGYIMNLTKSEFAILKYISERDGYVSSQEIGEKVVEGRVLTVESVAVHVCNVNKKANKICGRNLISFQRFKGYCIKKNTDQKI